MQAKETPGWTRRGSLVIARQPSESMMARLRVYSEPCSSSDRRTIVHCQIEYNLAGDRSPTRSQDVRRRRTSITDSRPRSRTIRRDPRGPFGRVDRGPGSSSQKKALPLRPRDPNTVDERLTCWVGACPGCLWLHSVHRVHLKITQRIAAFDRRGHLHVSSNSILSVMLYGDLVLVCRARFAIRNGVVDRDSRQRAATSASSHHDTS
jgi:hypothetical protein